MKVTPKENRTIFTKFSDTEMMAIDLKLKQLWTAREITVTKERYAVRRDNVLLNISSDEFHTFFKIIQ